MNLEQQLERLEKMNPAFSDFFLDMKIDGEYEAFKESLVLFEDEKWMHTYLTALAVGRLLKETCQQYVFLGGIAVLGNLMADGKAVPAFWRGSYDIDLASEQQLLPALRKGFVAVDKKQDFQEQITRYGVVLDKLSLDDPLDYEPIPHVIDCDLWEPKKTHNYFTLPITPEFWQARKNVGIRNLQIPIAPLPVMISLKAAIDQFREKDIQDIYGLLSIAEHTNYAPSMPKQCVDMLLREYENYEPVTLTPSKEFLRRLL